MYVARKGSQGTLYLELAGQRLPWQVGIQEKPMSKSIKVLALLGLVGLAAACGRNNEEEFVVVDPEPISQEPTYTGKFK